MASGDNDGFEHEPGEACADGGDYAEDKKSGTDDTTACDAAGKDRHRFYDYGFAIPQGSTINGIEVRLDAWANSSNNGPFMCVELSWDGGTTWTAAGTTPVLGTSEATFILGSASDAWGRTWSPADLADGGFLVRITDVATKPDRDFRLDWVAVQITYTPTDTPTSTPTVTSTPAPTPTPTPTPSTIWYFHNNPTPPVADTSSQAVLPLDDTAPSATTLYNYDVDRDAAPGLIIAKGGGGPTETDATKFQTWRTAPFLLGLTIEGPVRVQLWSAIKDFGPTKAGKVNVFLRDCGLLGCTEIAGGTLPAQAWQGGSPTWVQKTITIPGVDYTIPLGDYLEVKVLVDAEADDDMWFAYDTTSYDSQIELP